MHPNLSFDQAPPFTVPLRFFLTAPLFGIAAGVLFLVMGPEAFVSRWAPGTLAATHLLVAGFMLQVMCGALLQFIPVAAGGNIWRPAWVAGWVHPVLALAVVLLVSAFLSQQSALFSGAAHLFSVGILVYIGVVGTALMRTPAQGTTLLALRFAVVGLALTVLLGVVLATGLAGGRNWPLIEITQVHAAWGLGGWALMLVIGVSYYVVPMFQITAPYPERLAQMLPPALALTLAVWSLQLSGVVHAFQSAVFFIGLALAAVFAVTTLHLQARRRRKVKDPTLLFFRGGMFALIAVLLSALLAAAVPEWGQDRRFALWLGVLVIPGFFVSVICGMLYKIVPFINWLHLQREGGLTTPPPNMRQMIPERAMARQMLLHFAALAAFLAAVAIPELVRLAGLLFAASCAWLGWNLVGGVRVYLRFRDRIRAAAPDQES